MTWNIAHLEDGGIDAHADFIVAQDPDVVILQEVIPGQEAMYKSELEERTSEPWHLKYARACNLNGADPDPEAPNPTCRELDIDGPAILSRLPFVDVPDDKFLWGRDGFTDARVALRVKVRVGTQDVQVFGTHLAAGDAFEPTRVRQVTTLMGWMDDFPGPRILGGDLNAIPGSAPMDLLDNEYADAWAALTNDNGPTSFTWSVKSTVSKRLDYWLSQIGSAARPEFVARPTFPAGLLSDHYPVVAVYSFGSTPGNTPFGGMAASLPGRIEAEKFDEGGEGIAYHDTTTGNSGGQFRTTTDVDIEGTTDTGGGHNVGWITATEWLEFTVNVTTTGTYTLNARVASTGDGGRFHVEVDDGDKTGPLDVPNTGGWQNWTTVSKSGIQLSAGPHVVKFAADTNGTTGVIGNLNWLEFVPAAPATTLPGTIQAEDFDAGGEGVGYHDLTPTNLGGAYRPAEGVDIEATTDDGGGHNVGWFTAGEWLAYSATIQGGTYTITARIACEGAGGTFHIDVGGDRTGPITIPNTGAWQNWTTVTKTGVVLPSGPQTIKVMADTNGPVSGVLGNLNWLTFTLESGQTELLSDTFDSASLDTTNKWSIAVMSGSQDTTVPVTQSNGRLNIGPLLQGVTQSHYNGILSKAAYDLTGASVRVQVVTAANSATKATTSFTLPFDHLNHYRMYAEGGLLAFEKKQNDAKTKFSEIAFDPAQHAFWRIRHDAAADQLVWETAPDVGGAPGEWVERERRARELAITAMRIELKAGTWREETNPGTVVFDNVLAVRP